MEEIHKLYDECASNFSGSTDFELDSKQKCIWCGRFTTLLKNHKHCVECDKNKYAVCRRCSKPYTSAKYFTLDSERCDSCHRKYLKEKTRREEKKRQKLAENKNSSDEDDQVPRSSSNTSEKSKTNHQRKNNNMTSKNSERPAKVGLVNVAVNTDPINMIIGNSASNNQSQNNLLSNQSQVMWLAQPWYLLPSDPRTENQ